MKKIKEKEPLDEETVLARLKLATTPNCGRHGLFAAVEVKDAVVAGDVPLIEVSTDIANAMSRLPNSRNGKNIRRILGIVFK